MKLMATEDRARVPDRFKCRRCLRPIAAHTDTEMERCCYETSGVDNDMVTQKESKLSRKIMKQLRNRGVFCFKVHGNELTLAGLPDIIACVNGRFLGLETKLPGKRDNTSARQEYVHRQIREANGEVHVVTSPQEAMHHVRQLAKQSN